MSSQKGNTNRSRPQKHKNRTSFKNTLHDTSHRTKLINSIAVSDVCQRCKDIIDWKIKYKKYKLLAQPKKCVKCDQRNVKQAYHVMCRECGKKLQVCTKCCQSKEIVPAAPDKQEQIKLDAEIQDLLKTLPERKRRTFLRYMNKINEVGDAAKGENENAQMKSDLIAKLNELKIDNENSSEFDDFDDLSSGTSDIDEDRS